MLQAKLKEKQRLHQERTLCLPYSNFSQFNCNEKTFLCFVKTSKCIPVFCCFQLSWFSELVVIFQCATLQRICLANTCSICSWIQVNFCIYSILWQGVPQTAAPSSMPDFQAEEHEFTQSFLTWKLLQNIHHACCLPPILFALLCSSWAECPGHQCWISVELNWCFLVCAPFLYFGLLFWVQPSTDVLMEAATRAPRACSRAAHFMCKIKLGLCLPVCTTVHLSTLNLICWFTAQSQAAVRTFSASTQTFLFLLNMITL